MSFPGEIMDLYAEGAAGMTAAINEKKRLAHFQSAIMEMSGHFFRLSCKGS